MTRTETITRWFGINPAQHGHPFQPADLPPPAPGQILLITGPSGAGKSTLLRQLRRTLARRCMDLDRLRIPNRPVIDLFNHIRLEDALAALSRVGLAEAHTWLLPPAHLSAGQRWRLRLALASVHPRLLAGRPLCIMCDEFAALLDRITAAIVAHRLRRLIDHHPHLSAIVATSHADLHGSLQPDQTIECDFGQIRVVRDAPSAHPSGSGVPPLNLNPEPRRLCHLNPEPGRLFHSERPRAARSTVA